MHRLEKSIIRHKSRKTNRWPHSNDREFGPAHRRTSVLTFFFENQKEVDANRRWKDITSPYSAIPV